MPALFMMPSRPLMPDRKQAQLLVVPSANDALVVADLITASMPVNALLAGSDILVAFGEFLS
jgi:hypothetical protein